MSLQSAPRLAQSSLHPSHCPLLGLALPASGLSRKLQQVLLACLACLAASSFRELMLKGHMDTIQYIAKHGSPQLRQSTRQSWRATLACA